MSNPESATPAAGSPHTELTKNGSLPLMRPALPISPEPPLTLRLHLGHSEDEKSVVEVTAETSPSTSGASSGNSGKSDMPRNDSTGMTSLESKLSSTKPPVEEDTMTTASTVEAPLEAIQEVREIVPTPMPTVFTVEKAAATKIYFECFYNQFYSGKPTPRSLRRRELENALCEDTKSSPEEKDDKRRAWAQRESEHLREIRKMKARTTKLMTGHANLDSQYEVVKVLGKGSFGVVRLVREKTRIGKTERVSPKQRRDVFAMKVIRKSDMLRNSQEGHLKAERDFLVASERSRCFQDASNLYLVMEYMPGGDFLGLLIRDNTLSETVTRFYIAEMILCIEEAHSLKWIHRDVKPDNFLISSSGHLKISDFGLAFDGHWSHDQAYYNNHRYSLLTKLGLNVGGDSIDRKEGRTIAQAMKMANVMSGGFNRHEIPDGEYLLNWRNRKGNRTYARSVVGTSQYMAPEVVRGELYDARCDWWSVGIILYECLYGHTPFLAEEGGRAQTKQNIIRHKQTFSFPHRPGVSTRCQDLIRRVLSDKSERICSPRYRSKDTNNLPGLNRDYIGRYVYPNDAEEIKSHRWFREIPWDRVHTMTPPFIPAITSLDDTHYFDEEEPISDFSTSHDDDHIRLEPPKEAEVDAALGIFNREIQILARGYVATAYDTMRLRRIEREIDAFVMTQDQKDYLKHFVRIYGHKERKRPRDKILRDRDVAPAVLEIRKRSAFLGYTYRRIRFSRRSERRSSSSSVAPGGSGSWRAAMSFATSSSGAAVVAAAAAGGLPGVGPRRSAWYNRGRASLH